MLARGTYGTVSSRALLAPSLQLVLGHQALLMQQCLALRKQGGRRTKQKSTCLSSTPMYTMGVYLLYEGNYQALDSIRNTFFWQGTNKKRKYHMVKWEALIRPKEFGGVDFLDIRVMNICLLVKWIERLEKRDDSICIQLLCRKYLGDKSIFQLNRNAGSQFWKRILSVRQWCQWGRRVQVHSRKQTRFWLDLWTGECPLSVEFHQLFSYCRHPNIYVSDACANGTVQIDFRRSLNDEEMAEWARLVELVNQTTLTEGRDVMKWVLEKRGNYTTRSLYKAMTFGGVKDPVLMRIWRCRIPLKIKFFLWMAFNDRIQAAVQLKKKKWSGPEECKLCGERELLTTFCSYALWRFLCGPSSERLVA
ncbi:hypothetical protein PVAP13_2NG085546 [Panicum virgatum]|uniref:Reverse transcriptase zinc-binding domain-containing protein n=1 Tax=Panicum virgatum TaxID=38727 RepID=A0A8T0VDH4_PANVG|nr:hypothetical protein PVAP13_2NG085546 [Panicum virgatum]